MKVLVINAGSSSLKYQLIDMDTHAVMAKGLFFGLTGSKGRAGEINPALFFYPEMYCHRKKITV